MASSAALRATAAGARDSRGAAVSAAAPAKPVASGPAARGASRGCGAPAGARGSRLGPKALPGSGRAAPLAPRPALRRRPLEDLGTARALEAAPREEAGDPLLAARLRQLLGGLHRNE